MKSKALYIIYGVLISIFAGFCIGGSAFGVESSSETPFKVNVDSETMLSLTIGGTTNNTVSIDITPTGSGGTFKESDEISVTTKSNNLTGHTLNMFTSPSALTSADNNGSSIPELDSSTDGYTSSNFLVNRWGYAQKFNNNYGNYFGIGDGAEIQNLTEPTHGTASSVKFATKIDTSLPAGSYATTVTFTVTAKPMPIYMQDITSATCPSDRTLVYDLRDGKAYYIQEITAGGTTLCWMTTNLDLAGGTPLYSDTSNVPDGYPLSGAVPFYTLPASSATGYYDPPREKLYNSNSSTCGDYSPCYSYYTFPAVSAGINPSSGSTNYDICPRGWRLPTTGEYSDLAQRFKSSSNIIGSPWYGVYSRNFYVDSFSLGDEASYWTSLVYGDQYGDRAYTFNYASTYSPRITDTPKSHALAVRCVAK